MLKDMLKKDLIVEFEKLQEKFKKLEEANQELLKDNKAKEINLNIFKAARQEDKEKLKTVSDITLTVNELKKAQTDSMNHLNTYYAQQFALQKRDLDEQNLLVRNLFSMMDNTINLQVYYYNLFKNMFISNTTPQGSVPEKQKKGE